MSGPEIFPYQFEYEQGRLVRMKMYDYTFVGMVHSGTQEVSYNEQGLPAKITQQGRELESYTEELYYDALQRLIRKKILKITGPAETHLAHLTTEKNYSYSATGKIISIQIHSHNSFDNSTFDQTIALTYDENENLRQLEFSTQRSSSPDYTSKSISRFLAYDQKENPLLLLKVPFEALPIEMLSKNNNLESEQGRFENDQFVRNGYTNRILEYNSNGYTTLSEVECKYLFQVPSPVSYFM